MNQRAAMRTMNIRSCGTVQIAITGDACILWKTVGKTGKIQNIKNWNFKNVRILREVLGC